MLQKVLFAAIAAFTLVVSGVAPVAARSHDGLRPVQRAGGFMVVDDRAG